MSAAAFIFTAVTPAADGFPGNTITDITQDKKGIFI